jgi:hypothetical protein
MGMLMHHTWLEQQKQEENKVEKPVEEKAEEKEQTTEPVKRTGGRRKK